MKQLPFTRSTALRRLSVVSAALLGAAAVATGLVVASEHSALSDSAADAPSGFSAAVPPTCADRRAQDRKPTIVIVHGAFADPSGWSTVSQRLQRRGYTVYAPANPLRGLESDAAYIRTFLDTIDGPIVLVGHSYGGGVITNAARNDPRVVALVYVAALALDTGETAAGANSLGGHPEESLLMPNLHTRPLPGGGKDRDVYIDVDAFRRVFAADLPPRTTAVMAASQRPVTQSALNEKSGPPAWEQTPSWYLVARQDQAIPPTAERFMARRAGATTIEVNSSHAVMVRRPGPVTDVIVSAAGAKRCGTAGNRSCVNDAVRVASVEARLPVPTSG